MSDQNGLNRREFLRTWGRNLTLAGLLSGGALLVKRPARPDDKCTSDGICSRCAVLQGCGLPQALSARQAESKG